MPNRKRERIEIEIPSKAIRVKHASCRNGHSLMDSQHKINGYPSAKVILKFGDHEGPIYLDPIYGSFKNIPEVDVPENAIVEFSCPECHVSLTAEDRFCEVCSAPLFAIHLPNGGIIEGCLRNGCRFHNMRLIDGDALLKRLDEEDALDSYL
jgi:hypothetical protein